MTDERRTDGGKWKIGQCSVGPETATSRKWFNQPPEVTEEEEVRNLLNCRSLYDSCADELVCRTVVIIDLFLAFQFISAD